MHLHFNSRIEIVREQALIQGAKFPGAFAYSCDLMVDGKSGKVTQTRESTARSVTFRALEAIAGSKGPGEAPRTYEVMGTVSGDVVFVLQKPERLRASVLILDRLGEAAGVLSPRAGIGPRFALLSPNEELICHAEPLSARGLDFDFRDPDGVTIATLRLMRKSVAKVAGRLAIRGAAVMASHGIGDMMGKDRFELALTEDCSQDVRWLLVASAVACSAERGAGQALGQVTNGVGRAATAARSMTHRPGR